jgi:site-specific DNA-methyltransferase (adenine-specific)
MASPYYADDLVTLYHGDCREEPEWLHADVLVTDPPYGIGWKRGVNHARASKSHAGIQGDADTGTRDAALALWGERPAVVFGSFYAPQPANVRHFAVYRKPPDAGAVGSTTGFRRDVEPIFLTGAWPLRAVQFSSLIESGARNVGNPSGLAARYGHPHAKPVDVLETLIAACPPGIIADPFAGAGSTLVAARNLGRRAVGVEIDEAYCERAARRLSQGVLDVTSA